MSGDKTQPLDLASCPVCDQPGYPNLALGQGQDDPPAMAMCLNAKCMMLRKMFHRTIWNDPALRSPRPSPADLCPVCRHPARGREAFRGRTILTCENDHSWPAAPPLVSDLRKAITMHLFRRFADETSKKWPRIQWYAEADDLLALLGYRSPEGETAGRGGMGKEGEDRG